MVITSIKKSKKGNILIYADNNYIASILPEVFLKSGLKVGSYIDEEILEKLNEEINLNKAKEKALRLLSFRAHSKQELKNKIQNSLGEKYAEKATEKMENLGLINDKEFAFTYAKELFLKKLYAVKRVKYELAKKGIENNIIEKENTIKLIKNIKNCIITYKLKTPFGVFYPSSIIEELGTDVIKEHNNNNITYSKINDKINLTKKLDNLIKYNIKDSKLKYLNKLYGRILYVLQINCNDNEFIQYKDFIINLKKIYR